MGEHGEQSRSSRFPALFDQRAQVHGQFVPGCKAGASDFRIADQIDAESQQGRVPGSEQIQVRVRQADDSGQSGHRERRNEFLEQFDRVAIGKAFC